MGDMEGATVPPLRVAVVHDWLVRVDGSIRTLAAILECFPQADLFSLIDFLPEESRALLGGRMATTSFLQRMPGIRTRYWYYMPLMPLAIEQLDLRGYDLVVSSSSNVAKGVLVGADQVHVSYVYSPMRFIWDLQPYYLERFGWNTGIRRWLAAAAFHYLRQWDQGSSHGVDSFVAPSAYVARRIHRAYRREADVLHPPVDTDRFRIDGRREDFYLTAAFMNPFKNVGLVVRGFTEMPDRKLYVVGDGPERREIERIAGPNVRFLGAVDDATLLGLMQRARAFVYAAPEDFGIVMAEAQACGTPVIALAAGGATEIVRDLEESGPTGVLYQHAETASIVAAVDRFETHGGAIRPEHCRENALRFRTSLFRERFSQYVHEVVRSSASGRVRPRITPPGRRAPGASSGTPPRTGSSG